MIQEIQLQQNSARGNRQEEEAESCQGYGRHAGEVDDDKASSLSCMIIREDADQAVIFPAAEVLPAAERRCSSKTTA